MMIEIEATHVDVVQAASGHPAPAAAAVLVPCVGVPREEVHLPDLATAASGGRLLVVPPTKQGGGSAMQRESAVLHGGGVSPLLRFCLAVDVVVVAVALRLVRLHGKDAEGLGFMAYLCQLGSRIHTKEAKADGFGLWTAHKR